MKRLVAIVITTLLAGCCSYNICKVGGKNMLLIENEGWRLFSKIQIAAGDPQFPNQNQPIWFTDTVNLDTNVQILNRVMQEQHVHKINDLYSFRTEESIFFILKRYVYHTSVELVKDYENRPTRR